MHNNIKKIVQIMNEQIGEYGSNVIDPTQDQAKVDSSIEPAKFDSRELKIAARYLQIIGDPKRAKELLDKVLEASQVLHTDELDDAAIDEISQIMPEEI